LADLRKLLALALAAIPQPPSPRSPRETPVAPRRGARRIVDGVLHSSDFVDDRQIELVTDLAFQGEAIR
jgi:hypothetical protein